MTINVQRMREVIGHVESLGAYTQSFEIARLLEAYERAVSNLRTIDCHYDSLDKKGVRDLCTEITGDVWVQS